jgi:ParB family chromosome partitioning protein
VAPKQRLGKGLDALFPRDFNGNEDSGPGEGRNAGGPNAEGIHGGPPGGGLLVSPDKLLPNPGQPRKVFDEAGLRELAGSIREHGIIQPVIAEDRGDGTYTIVAGERRTRAARMAGLKEIPVIVRNYSEARRMEVSLIENIQRTDLNPVEEAAAYRTLMDLTGLSQDEVAARVGKNRSTVANALRLLKLPPAMRSALEDGSMSPGHARAILSLEGAANQETLFKRIAAGGISVREAERAAAALEKGESLKPPKKAATSRRDPELSAMEQKFIKTLGTKVVIEGNLARGSIRIDYYSMDDLDRLYGILEKQHEPPLG